MAKVRSQSLRSMGVTQLRKVATARGIKGLSKADRETVYRALRSTAVAPMSMFDRESAYAVQRNIGADMIHKFTARQSRRCRKALRKAGM